MLLQFADILNWWSSPRINLWATAVKSYSVLPLGAVIRRYGISFYADDTQLYVSPDDTGLIVVLVDSAWMSQNILQLNKDEPEILVIGSEAQREKPWLLYFMLLAFGALQTNYIPNNRELLLEKIKTVKL